MNSRSERIKKAIDDSGYSYPELEKLTGISKSSIHRYATGETKKIPIDCIEKIANATNTTSAYIMGWDFDDSEQKDSPGKNNLTEGEDSLLKLFRRVPEDQKQLVLDMIRVALGNQE